MELRELMASKNYTRIPLKKLATGHYKISAKINAVAGDFIVDTGASSTCVALSYASLFNLKHKISPVKAAGAGASGMDTYLSTKNSFIVNNKLIKNIPLILFDLSHVNNALTEVNEPIIHGIIGADLLKKCRAIIDYGRNCMYFK